MAVYATHTGPSPRPTRRRALQVPVPPWDVMPRDPADILADKAVLKRARRRAKSSAEWTDIDALVKACDVMLAVPVEAS